jgi:hypothetical protein
MFWTSNTDQNIFDRDSKDFFFNFFLEFSTTDSQSHISIGIFSRNILAENPYQKYLTENPGGY